MTRAKKTLAFVTFLATALSAGGEASARIERLRWTHPAADEVAGYHVYFGYARYTYAEPINVPTPQTETGAQGEVVFVYDLDVAGDADVWVAVTAYDADGLESAHSNDRCRGDCGSEPASGSGGDPVTDTDGDGSTQAQAAVSGFVLWNAATDSVIDADFISGKSISLASHTCTAIEVVVNAYLSESNSPGSVRYAFDTTTPPACADPGRSHESQPPYAWEGETGPGQFECAPTLTQPGTHKLTVTPFDGDDCTGAQGESVTLEFEVVEASGSAAGNALGAPGKPMLVD